MCCVQDYRCPSAQHNIQCRLHSLASGSHAVCAPCVLQSCWEVAAQNGPVGVILFTFVSNCQKCPGVHAIGMNLGQPVFPLWFQSSLQTMPLTGLLRVFRDNGSLLNFCFPCVFINTGGFSIVFVNFCEHWCEESLISVYRVGVEDKKQYPLKIPNDQAHFPLLM